MRKRLLLALTAFLCIGVASAAVLVGLRVGSVKGRTTPPSTPPPSASARPTLATPTPAPTNGATVYLYYYLWWTPQHWVSKLGPDYPLKASPLPRPGSTNSAGCAPAVNYSGASIVDLPQAGLYDQNSSSVYAAQIGQAAQAGVTGFLVSWQGTGLPNQATGSSGYDRRLALLVAAVDTYNRRNPAAPFHLALALSAFGDYSRPAVAIVNDLNYFAKAYASNPAFTNRYSPFPVVIFMDSRKFSLATVKSVWTAENGRLYLVGDETPNTWARDAPYLDGSSYYWSSENPTTNGRAGADLISLAAQVRGDHKTWFAPFIPGYDTQLLGGSCVPRNGVSTLTTIWDLNAQSHPNGWFGISWNEFVENTYLQPSQAYGSEYLTQLKRLIEGGA
ncbi:MAG TPA: hypothetical protein VNH20_00565 [Candidatus Dormibacteraeota bacterium]|nr:hypothetical protein [Candidatus Dormibacteraeota bacterium]HVC38454.1 hypothetical protein [Candidatus Dormibacteraeota bacterium]